MPRWGRYRPALSIFLILFGGGIDQSWSGNAITSRPQSYLDLKYQHVVRQQRDFTCGAASLATILKHHFGMPVTEGMLFWMLVKRYEPEELKKKAEEGLSFEDLSFVAESLGFETQAAIIEASELEKLNGPVIIQLNLKKFDHFAVLRKKTKNLAYLADPILGEIAIDNAQFLAEFKGPVLAVWPPYVGANFLSGLSTIRDPISVERALNRALIPSGTVPRVPF